MSSLRWKNQVGFRMRGPVVLAAGDRAVEHLGGIDRTRQARLAGRHAVDVLDVEGAEVGDLDQSRDRRQARLGRAELEALDLVRLGIEGPAGDLLRDGERRLARPRVDLHVAAFVRART